MSRLSLTAAIIVGLPLLACSDPDTSLPAPQGEVAEATPASVEGAPPPGTARIDWFEYSGRDAMHEGLDPGPDQYLNPVLTGFYPDPSNTRAGEDYYLVTSTFAYYPGLPVFHSTDLVNWTQIGNAVDRPDMVDFGELGLSRGLFAPAIEHHDGIFYILNTCVDCGGNFLITAEDPAGPWSDPVWLPELEGGIDPSLFVDEDGRAFILNNGPPDREPEYEGHRAVWIQEFNLETLETFGPRTVLIDGGVDFSTQPIWIEGPHIYKVDGTYFLSAAEGGTAINHSQVVLTADSPTGPYTPVEGNPVLTQRDLPADRDHPITSAGHADLVQTPDGDWWATFLAVRPYEGDRYNTGRETFLMPVDWSEGYPRITGPGEAIPLIADRPDLPAGEAALPMSGDFTVREEFDSALAPHWMMLRNPQADWYRLENGALWLDAREAGLGDRSNPAYLGRRQQHLAAEASLSVSFVPEAPGDRAGLAVFQNDDYWYSVSIGQDAGGETVLEVRRRAGPGDPADGVILHSRATLHARTDAFRPGETIRLRTVIDGNRLAFDAATGEGRWQRLAEDLDATILSTQTAGGFVGVTIGPFAEKG